MEKDGKNLYFIRSVNRALSVFNSFDTKHLEWGVTDLSIHLNLHKSTVHRLMSLLESEGFLEKNDLNQKYRLSLKFLELGRLVQDSLDARKIAFPFLERLSEDLDKTVHLVVRDKDEAVYIERIDRPDSVVQYTRVGRRLHLHCSAAGKVFLAEMSPGEITRIFENGGPEVYTENTISHITTLIDHVKQIKQKGYAVDNEELEYGLMCVGAPIRNYTGKVVAAVSVSGPPQSFKDREFGRYSDELVKTARIISFKLGFKESQQSAGAAPG